MNLKPLVIGDLTAKIPVIQGGMGVGISLSGLAGSVASCGGVGIISTAQIGYREDGFSENPIETNLKAIGKEIARAREIAKGGIIGVNIMVATKRYADYVREAVKSGVDLIISGAGLPTMLPDLVRGSRTKIAPIVSTVKSASVICKLWERKYSRLPDLVVIEGPRAGGHLGFTREQLEKFTPGEYEKEIKGIMEVVEDYGEHGGVHIPVAVAGGIYGRDDMEKALALGADAVQMGTRFVTTYECDASDAYKQAYINAKKEDICIVDSPVGMPGRAISNKFLCSVKQNPPGLRGKCYNCLEHCNPATIPYCITRALAAAAKGDTENALLFCGDNAWRSDHLEHVEDIIKELTQ
ncbi:NAD(P)H-dependent flavin oxidoreductase [Murimonas intestini]|uniref:Probable nitronate monooxygenase n=1 Tax=Murimonas intestini TaxID=1337051 RepID=A0AB73T5B1_9FIRM|nr:nitronate monooxygenase family protein [Murimonas intestini]MCR1840741.1 nitronate monooxygenase family protein [Murimonas intestini]MCR1865207.1 nitronate monooxygenase family protein [Murimonas intestini]MCR1883082.1 nitronate monooxygenase family protein [Murimonas intestini]